MKHILTFLKNEDGPTAVEYAVMLALIVMAAIASIGLMGQETLNTFSNARDQIDSAFNGS